MKFKAKVTCVLMSVIMAVSCTPLSSFASARENAASYYDRFSKGTVKEFVKLYQKDEQKGKKYFIDELTVDGGPVQEFFSAEIRELFRTNAEYGAVIKYEKGEDFDNGDYPEFRQFRFTFFRTDGSYFSTPAYDVLTTKALSVKQILKDSGIPDCKKIAAAEVTHNECGIEKLSLGFNELKKGGWLGEIVGEGFDPPSGAYLVSSITYRTERPYAFYVKEDGTIATGTADIDGVRYVFDKDGSNNGRYTGWAKSKSGKRRYYDKGILLTDWQIINGKRYHFGESGYADTGRVKIGGCTYTFSSKGVWSGKRSKSGARPSDFAVGFSAYYFNYESGGGKMTKTVDYDLNSNKKDKNVYAYGYHKLSAMDTQILWSIISEYGLTEADTSVNYDGTYAEDIAKKYPDIYKEISISEPETKEKLTFTANGKSYEFTFTDDVYQVKDVDKTVYGIWKAYQYLTGLVYSSKAYKELPPRSDWFDTED